MNIIRHLLCGLTLVSACAAATPYLGVGVGYFMQGEDLSLAIQGGFVVKQSESLTHSVEGEILWTRDKEGPVSMDVMPIMVNYLVATKIAPKLSLEFGAGVGVSLNRLEFFGRSDTNSAFAFQVLSRLAYHTSEKTSVYAGLRYLNIGKTTLSGITATVGDDTSFECGLRYKF